MPPAGCSTSTSPPFRACQTTQRDLRDLSLPLALQATVSSTRHLLMDKPGHDRWVPSFLAREHTISHPPYYSTFSDLCPLLPLPQHRLPRRSRGVSKLRRTSNWQQRPGRRPGRGRQRRQLPVSQEASGSVAGRARREGRGRKPLLMEKTMSRQADLPVTMRERYSS